MLVLGSAVAMCAESEPKMTVRLSQEKIYEGQSVICQIIVENAENPPAPEIRSTDDYDVVSMGQQSLDSQQVTIINGVMQQVVHRGRDFRFRVTPKRTGEVMIPAPMVNVGGKPIIGPDLRITVLPPDAQDLAVLELAADRSSIYPTQAVTVTLSVFVKGLPAPASDHDPLSVQKRPPMLKIPWLTEQEAPAALTPKEDWQTWIKQFHNRQGEGFGINDLVQNTAFSMFGESNALAFQPKSQSVTRRDAQGREVQYWRYDFPRTFTAKQSGPITLGAVTLQGQFGYQMSDSGQLSGKEIYAASKPLLLMVKDVPQEGQPDTYIGAIGHFQLDAELTPRQSKVGDPMTFTLTLIGPGSLTTARAPDLSKVPAVASRFKIYEATQKNEGNSLHFVYSLRPLAEGDEPFPAVPLSYFDVDQDRYVTVRNEPIPISIAKAERLSGDQIVASPRVAGQNGKDLETRREGIFANITDVTMARDQSVHPLRWLAGLGGCFATYFLLAFATTAVRRRTQDKSALRRRAAVGRAHKRLREARGHWQSQQVREAADSVQAALCGLVADVADVQDAGLTPKDVLEHLAVWNVPEAVVAQVGRLLDACDAAQYGGLAASGSFVDEAQSVLEAVIKTLRSQRRFR
jgi:hypothetical protein